MRSKEEIIADAEARIAHLEYFENYAMLKEKQRGDLALMKELVALVTDTNVGGKWIPCSERLPEPLENLLYWYKHESMAATRVEKLDCFLIAFYDKCEKSWSIHGKNTEVIAWQPLPTAYKGEQE